VLELDDKLKKKINFANEQFRLQTQSQLNCYRPYTKSYGRGGRGFRGGGRGRPY